MTPIERAVAACGSQQALATAAGISPQAVSFWVNGLRKVSAEYALKIEEATHGAVSRFELRPDVFGPSPSASSASVAA